MRVSSGGLKFIAVAAVLLMIGVYAVFSFSADAPAKSESEKAVQASDPWQIRCSVPEGESGSVEEKDIKVSRENCEIVQKLIVAETGERFVEFAVGLPADQDAARGVVILPLGMLLPGGAQLKIDDQDPFAFDVRFCTNAGCFAYLSLERGVIDMMKKGEQAEILFKDAQGKTVRVDLTLRGFTKALKKLG